MSSRTAIHSSLRRPIRPHEIFHAMDVALITNQWWSAYISAKQLSQRYFKVLEEKGYPGNGCRYCSLGLACTLADDPATAPWGWITAAGGGWWARLTCDCIQHVFEQWADRAGYRLLSRWKRLPGLTRTPTGSRSRMNGGKRSTSLSASSCWCRKCATLLRCSNKRPGDGSTKIAWPSLMDRINEQESYIAEAARHDRCGSSVSGVDCRFKCPIP